MLAWDPKLSCGMIHMCYHLSALVDKCSNREKEKYIYYMSFAAVFLNLDSTFHFPVSYRLSCLKLPSLPPVLPHPAVLSTITSDLPVFFFSPCFLSSLLVFLPLPFCTVSLSPPSLVFISFHLFSPSCLHPVYVPLYPLPSI